MKFIVGVSALLLCACPAAAQIYDPKPDPKEEWVPVKLDADGPAIVVGMNRFGFDLYAKLREERGDVVVSPASISTAFGLAYAGARGSTAKEIASVLHYPTTPDFHRSFGTLLRTMDLHQNGRTLTVNNAIWLQQGLKVRPEYVALVDRDYGAGLQWVDYRGNANAARDKINRWVESKTNDKIRNLLTPLDVTKETRSVLVNTAYFKADWEKPFEKAKTKNERFTMASGARVLRPLMHNRGEFHYAEGKGFKVLRLPYRGDETDMLVFLPDSPDGLAKLEHSLDAASVEHWSTELGKSEADVLLTLPKFRIEQRYVLNHPLIELGMRAPFSNDSDFSGLKLVAPDSPDREDWNLKIGSVVHQVFVEVEEKGTEAAAATAISTILITGVVIRKHVEFRADHPFLFLIRDSRTNAILFMGRYTGEK
jgi:serpin B